VAIALLFVYLLLPYFNTLAGKQLDMSAFQNWSNIITIFILIIGIGLLAGTYPAFFLASFQPVSVLRGEKIRGGRRSIMRTILVVFQFSVSIVLVIGTLIIRQQVDYIQNTDLGFDKDNLIIIHKTDDLSDNLKPFKQSLMENPVVLNAANSGRLMGQNFGNSVFTIVGATGAESHLLWTLGTDPDFVETYRIEMAEGRYFEEGREADQSGCVINEAAARALGLEESVGRQLISPGADNVLTLNILGVMKDFHFESMHQRIRPLIVFPMDLMGGRGRFISVRIQPGMTREALAYLETTWNRFAQNQAFEYEFFDDHFAQVYAAEIRTGDIFFSFAILAIIIASLGLFGLAAFITEQRTKEIGIRKVLGSTVPAVIYLLIQQFTKWVFIANIIAWPVAYVVMRKWLQNFAYQAPLSLWIFLGSAFMALVIAVLTVGFQSIKAAVANPVDSLRYE
jgi:putative ABC transport system permease protein